ncbi:hypothetical protein [Streptomyces sp. NPDC005438]|uniref:hypothetical protein n=1 Tax=Streptomyces sp. NPDC005438 TaxID=3156880 RepID=UPI0033A33E2E
MSQDEPKTETTLTTKIKINIPGSRPIPPVVMRTRVDEEGEGSQEGADPTKASGSAAEEEPGEGNAEGGQDSSQPEISDWFAPRKMPTRASEAEPGPSPEPAAPVPEPQDRPGLPRRLDGRPGEEPAPEPPSRISGLSPRADTPADGSPAYGSWGADPQQTGGGVAPGVPGAYDAAQPGYPSDPMGSVGEPGPSTLDFGTGPLVSEPGGDYPPAEEMPYEGPYGATPEQRPEYPGSPEPPGGRVSSDTLVSGIPAVPGEPEDAVPQEAGPADAAPASGPPAAPDRSEGGSAPRPKRGRSLGMLAGVGVVVVLAVAYGAGLMLDHADVPRGTTALGVDIGGLDQRTAVNRLEDVADKRATVPLTVSAEGKRSPLKPEVAGLTLDAEETVRKASGRDYNPISVIGSLFGQERTADPVVTVDEEKLQNALGKVASGGDAQDGMVKFANGRAVGVRGKPHPAVDVSSAAATVESAFRERAASGENGAVRLPMKQRQPQVTQKEIDRAIREFGKPAMSGLVTVKAGDASIQFSPQKSLPKFLSMKSVNGRLVDSYDLPELKKLYGSTFDGVRVRTASGTRGVMPQDVVSALRVALKETDPAKRVQEIPLNPN